MATSKTPRGKTASAAATEAAKPAVKKQAAAKTATSKAAPAAEPAAKPAKKVVATKATKAATKAATKPLTKPAAETVAQTATKTSGKTSTKATGKTAGKTASVPADTVAKVPAKKAAVKAAVKAGVKAAPAQKPAKKVAPSAVPATEAAPVKATPVKKAAPRKAAAPLADDIKSPARKAVTPAVDDTEAVPAAKVSKKSTIKTATKAGTQAASEVPPAADAPAPKPARAAAPKAMSAKSAKAADPGVDVPAAKPVRGRKSGTEAVAGTPPVRPSRKASTPAVAAPVAALVAEVAAALEQAVPAQEADAARGRPATVPARKKTKARGAKPAAEIVGSVVGSVVDAIEDKDENENESQVEGREETPAVDAQRVNGRAAPVRAAAGLDWQWQKTQPGLFGRYDVLSARGEVLASVDLQGSALGRYRCTCDEFQDSEVGDCAHSQWLVGQLTAAREGQAARLAAGPDTPYSELTLSAGWERRLVWRLGQGAGEALRTAAAEVADEDGRALAPLDGPALPALLQAAAEEAHELRVAPEVWQQLALSADAGDRVERLAQRFEQGLASPALQSLLKATLPDLQWEAALFAVCAGRALLADESPLPQRTSAVAAALLWQTSFDVGTVAIVAPAELQSAWRDEVQRLLGAWPATWTLTGPEALTPAAGCELLIVDAVETLTDTLPALQALRAPQLVLIAQRELLGTALLAPLVAWIDEARRGPYAALRRLGADAGKRQQREALETVMLARRRRDLAEQLPVALQAQLSTTLLRIADADAPGVRVDAADLGVLQRLHQRWARTGSLSAGEQLQLQQALLRARHGEGAQAERRGEARAAALVRLLPDLVPARAERVVVFAQQDAALRPLALALQDLGLPLANLRQHQSAEVRALELQAWADGEASVLLATDAACAGLDLRQEGSVLVHADVCWSPALMRQRQARVGREGGPVPAWVLVLASAFDDAVLAAHADADALPSAVQDGEAGAIPFLAGADLQAFMEALGRALAMPMGA